MKINVRENRQEKTTMDNRETQTKLGETHRTKAENNTQKKKEKQTKA
jgi:hypothetical protein